MIENAILAMTSDDQTAALNVATKDLLRKYEAVAREHVFGPAKAAGLNDRQAEERVLASAIATLTQGVVKRGKELGCVDPIGEVAVGLGMLVGGLPEHLQERVVIGIAAGIDDGANMVLATRPPPGVPTN